MVNLSATIRVPKAAKGSGYNPYQTGHGAFQDKRKSRAYRSREFRKLLEKELAKYQ